MLLLMSRAFDYNLKTMDLLELCGGDRVLSLETVVGILQDGEAVVTEVALRAPPKEGQRGQWEQVDKAVRYEKRLVVQMCSLLLGFTSASTYFSALDDGFYFMEAGLERKSLFSRATGLRAPLSPPWWFPPVPEYCIDKFSEEVDDLLELTMKSKLVEKLSAALNKGGWRASWPWLCPCCRALMPVVRALPRARDVQRRQSA